MTRNTKFAIAGGVFVFLVMAAIVAGFVFNSVLGGSNDTDGDPDAPVPTIEDGDSGSYAINGSTLRLTEDLPFELDSLWVSQRYLDALIGLDSLKVFIEDELVNTINEFGEEINIESQTVALLDMVITIPESETATQTFILNGEESQFVLRNGDGYTATTKTWVEFDMPVDEVGEIDWLPFRDWFDQAGANFIQGISVTEDLKVHGRNEDTGEFYESPLTLEPGKEIRVWLAFFLPLDTSNITLIYDGDTEIPLIITP